VKPILRLSEQGPNLLAWSFCHFLLTISYPEQMRTNVMISRYLHKLLLSGSGRCYNNLGQRFMRRYYPDDGDLMKIGEKKQKPLVVRSMKAGAVLMEGSTWMSQMYPRSF